MRASPTAHSRTRPKLGSIAWRRSSSIWERRAALCKRTRVFWARRRTPSAASAISTPIQRVCWRCKCARGWKRRAGALSPMSSRKRCWRSSALKASECAAQGRARKPAKALALKPSNRADIDKFAGIIVVAHARDGASNNPIDDDAGGDQRAQERNSGDGQRDRQVTRHLEVAVRGCEQAPVARQALGGRGGAVARGLSDQQQTRQIAERLGVRDEGDRAVARSGLAHRADLIEGGFQRLEAASVERDGESRR